MACPACGDTEYQLIAPGYVECSGVRAVDEMTPVGRIERRLGVCGTRYHVSTPGGAGVRQCSCGLYAIGACPECGTAFCGDHSWPRGGQRLCASCTGRYEAEQQAIEANAREASRRRAASNAKLHAEKLAADRAALPGLARQLVSRGFPGGQSFALYGHSGLTRALSSKVLLLLVHSYEWTSEGGYDSRETRKTYVGVDQAGALWSVTDGYPARLGEPNEDKYVVDVAKGLRKLLDG